MRSFIALLAVLTATAAKAEDVNRGQALFLTHCAACHGESAKGDGTMVPVLSIRPVDLTQLSVENGGVFPTARIVRRVDGTTEVLAHGGPMPLFGLLLDGPSDVVLAPDGSEVIAPESIVDIVAWLQGLQEGG